MRIREAEKKNLLKHYYYTGDESLEGRFKPKLLFADAHAEVQAESLIRIGCSTGKKLSLLLTLHNS